MQHANAIWPQRRLQFIALGHHGFDRAIGSFVHARINYIGLTALLEMGADEIQNFGQRIR